MESLAYVIVSIDQLIKMRISVGETCETPQSEKKIHHSRDESVRVVIEQKRTEGVNPKKSYSESQSL